MTDGDDGAKQNAVKKPRKDSPTGKFLPSAEVKTAANAVICATQTTSSESVSAGLPTVLTFAECHLK